MNEEYIRRWMEERRICLEQSFVDCLHAYASAYKIKHGIHLTDIYEKIGCTKTDISRWRYHPCSTHATSRKAKYSVIKEVARLFGLSSEEEELLANRAGLSLVRTGGGLSELMGNYCGKRCEVLATAGVSERMFQYYMNGKTPAKQALLAILIAMELPCERLESILRFYGYCLSRSLPNDVVVLWHMDHRAGRRASSLLLDINVVLDEMELPLLMTRQRG